MCSGKRRGRAKLRALTRNLSNPQDEVYEKPLPVRGKRKANPERDFHWSVAKYLNAALPEGFWWTSIPAGGGGFRRGVDWKRRGYKAGTPDLVVFSPVMDPLDPIWGRTLWLELKAAKGSLSQVQKDTHAKLKALGHTVEMVKTLEQVQDALAEFCFPEVLKARVAC